MQHHMHANHTASCSANPKPRMPAPCASGHKSLQGLRPYMEDMHFILPQFFSVPDDNKGQTAFHFFGICDGHGGAKVSKRCSTSIPQHLKQELGALSGQLAKPEFRQQVAEVVHNSTFRRAHEGKHAHPIERALVTAFEATDKELTEDPNIAEDAKWMGTTAIAALVDNEHIWIANCGDCRAVLCRAGEALSLTTDHKPTCPFEAARVEDAGGIILRNSGTRLMGILAVSRAIGDHALQPHGLTATPETRHLRRNPYDQFMILASDGLWDVISNQDAVDLVSRVFKRVAQKSDEAAKRRTAASGKVEARDASVAPRVAASVLARVALSRGSGDNITVIVVDLQQPAEALTEAARRQAAAGRRAASLQNGSGRSRWGACLAPRVVEGHVGGLGASRSTPPAVGFEGVCDRMVAGLLQDLKGGKGMGGGAGREFVQDVGGDVGLDSGARVQSVH